MVSLFDTHTHFDVPDFDHDREQLAYASKAAGVEHLVLIGFYRAGLRIYCRRIILLIS